MNNVLSLFDGMSCGQLALNRAGIAYKNYYASEIDQYAIKIAQKNFPNTIQLGDIQKINGNNFSDIDLIMGGSPCQGFTFSGKRLGLNDPRSKLFFEFVRLVDEIKPKWFLLENVRMKKQDMDVVSQHLGVQPIFINSSLVSAQNRPRLYWTNIPNIILPQDRGIALSSVLESNPDPKHNLTQPAINRVLNHKRGRGKFFTRQDKKIGTITANYAKICKDYPFIFDNGVYRKLTPVECERLQTVPDNYTDCVSDVRRYHAIGNGWTVDVISHILGFIP